MNNKKNNLEQFEQEFEKEYRQEIDALKSLSFRPVNIPEFKIPGYNFIFSKAIQIAFAVPALVAVFGFFFYVQNTDPNKKDLSLLEESNNRILNQIDTLDYENTI